MAVREWVGLPSERFAKYQSWINKERPGICGTYCCAVLVHDFVHHQYHVMLPQEVLLRGMRSVVDNRHWYVGTFGGDLVYGLRQIMPKQQVVRSWSAKTPLLRLLSQATPQPCIVATRRCFGSAYGNHWLVAYAYGYDEKQRLWLRCYDNHGNHQAEVPASTLWQCIWIQG